MPASPLAAAIKANGDLLYEICLRLCLDRPKDARDLLLKTFKKASAALQDKPKSARLVLLQQLHKLWPRFAKSKKYLRGDDSKMEFNWKRALGAQDQEALLHLNPMERELVVLRFFAELPLSQITKITGSKHNEVVKSFRQCMEKLVNL
ncbi:MAG: sigma-70 family RNA polymerase sigma factor [Deltaproteobacteria bacterium]|nr:sigma-70 family RNA polymerase sigma factor [Deltaproteobacteria bacterium]